MKTAVVTLAKGEYWRGAKVLFHTLRKHGKNHDYTPVVMGMDRCDFAEAVEITEDYSGIPVSQENFPVVADKFFSLTLGFDRVVLIDSDVLCVGDCSLLWSDHVSSLPFYAVRDVASQIYYGQVIEGIGLDPRLLFNGGVMVFNRFDLDGFLFSIKDGKLKSYDGGDQGYLNHWFQMTKQEAGWLPLEYNACTDGHYPRMELGTERLVHFTGANAKPWSHSLPKDDRRMVYVRRWQAEWEECSR